MELKPYKLQVFKYFLLNKFYYLIFNQGYPLNFKLGYRDSFALIGAKHNDISLYKHSVFTKGSVT